MLSRFFVIAASFALVAGCGSSSDNDAKTCTGAASSPCAASGGAAGSGGAGGSSGAAGSGTGGAGGCTGSACNTPADVRVDAAWVDSHAGSVQLLDVRPLADFQTGHIPGSLHVSLDDLRATVNGVPSQVVDNATLSQVLGAAGLDKTAGVVVVGAQTDTTPARTFWTLEWAQQTDVHLLDGGFLSWTGSAESGAPSVSASSYDVTSNATERRVDADWILPKLGDSSVVLIDARSASEFAAGHIPGAKNVDWHDNVNGSLLKPTAEVEALYTDVPKSATVVAYCQTGTRASVTYFVMRWLGYPDVRLYDGSWAEWGSRPDLPKE